VNKAEESFGSLQWPLILIRPESGTLSSSHATGIEEYLLFSFYYKRKHAIQNPRLLNTAATTTTTTTTTNTITTTTTTATTTTTTATTTNTTTNNNNNNDNYNIIKSTGNSVGRVA